MTFATEIRHFAEIDSTNRYLLDEARRGAPEGVVAVAEYQTQGRGRLGRAWVAPPGASLLVSVLFRPPLPPSSAHVVSLSCALACADVVAAVTGVDATLKWPNDVVVGRRKLAGFLAEAIIDQGHIDGLVVGMGLNVNWETFPAELAETSTACNLEAGGPVDREALLSAWLREVALRYDAMLGGPGADSVVAEYRTRCSTIGQIVRVEQAARVITGVAVDVDDCGRLIIDDDGTHDVVSVGDLVHLRTVTPA